MTDKGIVTANILNDLILNLDKLINSDDIYLGLEEFSLGLPEATRAIDLCWGYAKVEPSTSTLAAYELVIGKGITRNSSGDIDDVQYDFTSLNLSSLLPSSQSLQNIYAFGSIYMTPNATLGNSPSVSAQILKGSSSGSPLLMTRELDLNTVLNMMQEEEIPAAEKPQADSIEIFKFLLNINFYNSISPELKDVEIYFHDKRLPRGWGGFADEFLATNISTYIIYKKEDFAEYLNTIEESVYNIIKSWINLRFWSPSFIDYWNTNSSEMPDRLKEYLELEFGIIIWG